MGAAFLSLLNPRVGISFYDLKLGAGGPEPPAVYFIHSACKSRTPYITTTTASGRTTVHAFC